MLSIHKQQEHSVQKYENNNKNNTNKIDASKQATERKKK